MVISNSERLASFTARTGVVTAGSDVAAELTLAGGDTAEAANQQGRTVTSQAILVPNPTG
jgi:hypothetical protein